MPEAAYYGYEPIRWFSTFKPETCVTKTEKIMPDAPPHRIALITGAARRIGAQITRRLHGVGFDVAIHYRNASTDAVRLQQQLEKTRPESTLLIQADLLESENPAQIVEQIRKWRGRLDLLVNNASSFFPTPLAEADETQWDQLMGSNLKAPFFLAREAAGLLEDSAGSIINLVDIHADRPLKGHSIYSMAKAGNAMMVKSLARELGPKVRVNGVAPGAILWPEDGMDDESMKSIVERTALKRPGTADDIARSVLFLAQDAGYITGQIIAVDGGRSIQQ